MSFTTSNNALMQDKIFLEDYSGIVQTCNTKCLKSYDAENLSIKEQLCLEKCYFKSLSNLKLISENYGDLMYQISQADK